jgi:hypothetical protein
LSVFSGKIYALGCTKNVVHEIGIHLPSSGTTENDFFNTHGVYQQESPRFLDAPDRSATSGRQVQETPWSEKNSNQLVGTEDPPQLAEAKKWNEHNAQQHRDGQDSLPCSTPKIRDAFMERPSMNPADNRFFSNLETSQHNSEYERLYESRINQRCIPEPVRQMQLPSGEHNLCQRKGANQRDPMAHEINVMLGENQGFINDRQGEYDKKIRGDHEILSHLVNDFLLQRLLAMTHGIFSSSGLDRPEK